MANNNIKKSTSEKASVKLSNHDKALLVMEKLIDSTNLFEEYFILGKNSVHSLSVLSDFSTKSKNIAQELKNHGLLEKGTAGDLIIFSNLFSSFIDKMMEITLQYEMIESSKSLGWQPSQYQTQKVKDLQANVSQDMLKCMRLLNNSTCPISLENAPWFTTKEKDLLCSRIHSVGKSIAEECYKRIDNGENVASVISKVGGSYRSSMSIYGVLKGRKDVIGPDL